MIIMSNYSNNEKRKEEDIQWKDKQKFILRKRPLDDWNMQLRYLINDRISFHKREKRRRGFWSFFPNKIILQAKLKVGKSYF